MNTPYRSIVFLALAGSAFIAGGVVAANGDVPEVIAEAASIAKSRGDPKSSTVVGEEGWLYFRPDLRHLGVGTFWGQAAARVSRATKPDQADPLPAILDFKKQLDRAGIELLVVPVPPKPVIYPEHIFAKARTEPRIDQTLQEFYQVLKDNGVRVLDLVPEFDAHKPEGDVYCRQDSHWSGLGCEIAAQLIAAELKKSGWFSALPRKSTFDHVSRNVTINGDLRRGLPGEKPPEETLKLRFIGKGTGDTLKPLPDDKASPVVLLGDSHNLVFHVGGDLHAAGAGLADQLALELGFPVDVVAVRGSGATPARVNLLRRARSPEYVAGKKVVVWCFAAREFTESSGWMNVPVVR